MGNLYVENISNHVQNGKVPDELEEVINGLSTVMTVYHSAIKEMNTKLEVLNDEFQSKQKRNPINHIKYRVKTPRSILEKLFRRGFEPTLVSAMENLDDIAGIRVICPFIDDIYRIADMLAKQSDLKILRATDYIKHPKANGYRSLHLIIEIPVWFSDGPMRVKVEMQIRTIAMDFWASLEHQLHYKDGDIIPEEIVEELTSCAQVIAETDIRMQNIHDKVAKYRYMDF